MSPKEAAHKTMDEVGGALIAISLVLIAVFLPTAFITGLQGTFYRQFAITIAASTAISAFVSLTLSPALAALLLKPHDATHAEKQADCCQRSARRCAGSSAGFNWAFDWLSHGYGALTARLVRLGVIVLIVYAGLLVLTYDRAGARRRPASSRSSTAATSSPPSSCRPARRSTAPTRWCARRREIMLARPGVRARRGLRRLRRRHLHQRAQHRRDLRHA